MPSNSQDKESQSKIVQLNSELSDSSKAIPPSCQIDRKRFQKRVKRDAVGSCFEAYEVQKEDIGLALPVICDEFRVGIGGEFLTVVPLNSDVPVTFNNVADGEKFTLSIAAILETDCENIVLLK